MAADRNQNPKSARLDVKTVHFGMLRKPAVIVEVERTASSKGSTFALLEPSTLSLDTTPDSSGHGPGARITIWGLAGMVEAVPAPLKVKLLTTPPLPESVIVRL
jgi:hypothetical protein